MSTTAPQYDVAISFLSRDENTAAALYGRLSDGLSVFFYPRKQEKLAGTDGLETMRTPFLDDSRVVVVLYREPWGRTPWTGVEQIAIQESCLNQGWHRLFFIVLDKTSAVPIWLPQNHVRFNYEEFGLEQAIGAIKARVQECGGRIEPMTALRRAALYEEEVHYIQDRKQIGSFQGMATAREKVTEVFAEIKRLCSEINAHGGSQITVGANAGCCVLRNSAVSLVVGWRQSYTNSTDGCGLKVAEFNAQVPLPDTREYSMTEPTKLNETTFKPDLSRAREYGWNEEGKPDQFLSSIALADRCVIEFLDLAARADRGEIAPPDW